MEARRAFVGERSYRQLWIMLAAILCAAALAVGVAFIAGSAGSHGATQLPVVVHPAPGSVLDQDRGSGTPIVSNPSKAQKYF